MPFLILIAFVSLVGIAVAFVAPGWSDLLLLAGPTALAALFLLVQQVRRNRANAKADWVVLDGSNVMHWKDGTPHMDPVKEVLACLTAQGFTPGVVFDANAGYLLSGRYRHDGWLSRTLGLPEDRVMVVNKGEPADRKILTAARDMGAFVVTNDRYRDWAEDFPEVKMSEHLARGGYRDGNLWLDLPKRPA